MFKDVLAHYELGELLGRGGMGEVYRARDLHLDRQVALKFLPVDLATNPERLARFRREAKLLASLNHPNIAAIYGVEQANGKNFLVMELAEGEDLSQRISRGPVSIEEAINIAWQIAAGLEEAHEKQIVHRDLKPQNIKVTPNGQVKILDFGLARAYVGEPADEEDLANSPTISAAMTQQGVILGTAAYMSPEQARGRIVDRRADLWSFGVILWEMLTGRQLFEDETVSDTLAAVLKYEPPYEELPEDTPAFVLGLIKRCLERDPRKRLRDIGEVRVRLEQWKNDPSTFFEQHEPASSATLWSRFCPWILIAVVAIGALAFWLRPPPEETISTAPLKLVISLEDQDELKSDGATNVFLSPRGDEIAYLTGNFIHLRALDELRTRQLEETKDATTACYSPDGKWLAFTSREKLKRVSVAGGPAVDICPVIDSRGIAWPNPSTLVFSAGLSRGLSMVSLQDSVVQSLTTVDSTRMERSHRWPHAMPDGKSVLFLCQYFGRDYDQGDIQMVNIETKKRITVYRGGASPRYLSTGHLLFARGRMVFAIAMDPTTGQTTGLATPVLDNVWTSIGDQESDDGSAQFDVAPNGNLIYRTASEFDHRKQLAVFDLESTRLKPVASPAVQLAPVLSPDLKSVAVMRGENEGTEIYVIDLENGTENRLTFRESGNMMGCWSPDSRAVYYSRSSLDGDYIVYRKPIDGSGTEEELVRNASTFTPSNVSSDGRWLLLTVWAQKDLWDIYYLDLTEAGSQPRLLVGGTGRQYDGRFSHDGRWVAYTQARGGQWQIYVQRFSDTQEHTLIFQSGKQIHEVEWGENDEALLLRNDDGFFRIPLISGNGSVLATSPRLLQRDSFFSITSWPTSSIFKNGKKAIVLVSNPNTGTEQFSRIVELVLVTNWFYELQRKLQSETTE